jgi:hypothetical protein
LRDDPLRALWAQQQIDNAKYVAGRHWQRIYEIAEIGMHSLDPGRERVDGGGNGIEILTEKRVSAMASLRRCRSVLGDFGDSLVRDVLGRGLCLVEVAASRGLSTQHGQDYLGLRLRSAWRA